MEAVVDNSLNHDCMSLFEVSPETAELQSAYEAWLKRYLESFSHNKYWGMQHKYLGARDRSNYLPHVSIDCRWRATHESGIGGFLRGLLTPLTIFPHHARTYSRRGRMASDAEALYNDWVMVGSDLYEAMQKCSKLSSPSVRPADSTSSPW